MTLVRIVKNWDWPDLMRQTPGCQGTWDGIRFTTEPVQECDYLLMLNNLMRQPVTACCPPENVWILMQEPYVRGFNDWMIEGLDVFSKVFTNCAVRWDERHVVSHPAIPWYVNRTYDELVSMSMPEKNRMLSWVVGNAADIPGHFKRLLFLKAIEKSNWLDIDLYGKAVRYIEDKWEGLAAYRYSIAVENSISPDYWTEKLADCFLSWTVPLYYGCTNLEKYFPPDSYIWINSENPRIALNQMDTILRRDDWQKRIPALSEARRLVLERYQLFPHMSQFITKRHGTKAEKKQIMLPPYKRSKKTVFLRSVFKLRRIFIRRSYRWKAEQLENHMLKDQS